MAASMLKVYRQFLLILFQTAYSQQIRFNDELDKFCKQTLKEISTISPERRVILDEIAKELVKKKYVVFTCRTNSRRTLFLQVWAQTSFNYFGLYNKFAFSIGDTITYVYPEVVNTLSESGFYTTKMDNGTPPGYMISTSKEYPVNIILSKTDVGTIDTVKGVVVSICFEAEKSNIAANTKHIKLPYQSPTVFEKTSEEKQKYSELNKQIAAEMFYVAEKTKLLIIKSENSAE